MKTTFHVVLAATAVATLLAAGSAEAGRPCRRLCKQLVAENIVEHCAPYVGIFKRACRNDVRSTIMSYCKRQPSGTSCLGN